MTDKDALLTPEEMFGELVIYPGKDGRLRLQAHLQDDTLWLAQKQMTELFGVDARTVSEHLQNIFKDSDMLNLLLLFDRLSEHVDVIDKPCRCVD